jgi:hypothetical protein
MFFATFFLPLIVKCSKQKDNLLFEDLIGEKAKVNNLSDLYLTGVPIEKHQNKDSQIQVDEDHGSKKLIQESMKSGACNNSADESEVAQCTICASSILLAGQYIDELVKIVVEADSADTDDAAGRNNKAYTALTTIDDTTDEDTVIAAVLYDSTTNLDAAAVTAAVDKVKEVVAAYNKAVTEAENDACRQCGHCANVIVVDGNDVCNDCKLVSDGDSCAPRDIKEKNCSRFEECGACATAVLADHTCILHVEEDQELKKQCQDCKTETDAQKKRLCAVCNACATAVHRFQSNYSSQIAIEILKETKEQVKAAIEEISTCKGDSEKTCIPKKSETNGYCEWVVVDSKGGCEVTTDDMTTTNILQHVEDNALAHNQELIDAVNRLFKTISISNRIALW